MDLWSYPAEVFSFVSHYESAHIEVQGKREIVVKKIHLEEPCVSVDGQKIIHGLAVAHRPSV